MAGHSKWAQIKRHKAATDAARSRLFSRHARTIAVEAKRAAGASDDPGLKNAIERAKRDNMPKANIERAIARGVGTSGASLETVTYEAYGPGGAAIVIEAVTDNRNRTTAEVKHLLSSHGATLCAPGSALWAFSRASDGFHAAGDPVALDEAQTDALVELMSALEDHDDVYRVATNARGFEDADA